jgi:NAD+ synthase (glutamine-hydrolysing)
MIRLALAQLNPCLGDIENNTREIIASINKAKAQNKDLIVLPMAAVSGYPPYGLTSDKSFLDKNKKALRKIAVASKGIIVILGFIDAASDYKRKYNAYAVLKEGRVFDVGRRIFLEPSQACDQDYFSAGNQLNVYNFKGYHFAVAFGQEVNDPRFLNRIRARVDFVINLRAHAFDYRCEQYNLKSIAACAQANNIAIFGVNIAGAQDNFIFNGGSFAVSACGKISRLADYFKPAYLTARFPVAKINKKTKKILFNYSASYALFQALCLGIKDYCRKNRFPKVIVGISGGIDSAVVAALAVAALGKENVIGLIMPSVHTSKETYRDSKKLTANLGIKTKIVPINDLHNSYLNMLKPVFKGSKEDATEENIQARIRGNLLMAFSNKYNYLVLNTGNKSEALCGYCTLYGDTVGGLGVLADIFKRDVYLMARVINKQLGSVIPVSIIKRPPSAELRPDHRDSDSLPPYEMLDPILDLYYEQGLSLQQIIAKGYKKAIVNEIITLIYKTAYKRAQATLPLQISFPRRKLAEKLPITNRFF